MIALIGAMPEEVAIIKSQIKDLRIEKKAHVDFYLGRYLDKEIVLMLCKPGKVNAAIATSLLLDNYKVDFVINIGSCGALVKDLEVGDLIVATQVVHFDVDARHFGYELGQVPQMPAKYLSDEDLVQTILVNTKDFDLGEYSIHLGLLGTSDSFISDKELKKDILEKFPALLAVDMEAAAIAQTCYNFGIRFIICRSVSDKAEEGSRITFDEFLGIAAQNSSKITSELIKRI
ncbi:MULTISPECIES: 5'-methylthioadenosine/adenosylhomocysteine nucleosidase [unclassified Gemella]|uniref:5'-methylthioadenosine/adenosylhomocysteine nucleosidase n=1 Tax=unclassified Gemella TaxID=2624949 RepID=UPI001073C86B|nr:MULTISPECIES: 5'-methylthioadenosine/adenosylhomocysteine nucleosidase [unclassified Gemella]MBF0710751.1 5'-methylthioadenosine/adenosylhomocysteine nucleosidase [Gemella sp. GL1.1]MBF0746680.1 5'-methylthioadenosine/adenosylhomocysteine nucleosidase [Gemella sp. 19428wG2_WT2a]NYS28095.1 5'-methylthioadenosine/adenosylhomocysteine nucleosidase [Gemella sp. GL1]TFU60030.1 5'-methylthioadenosine/adenosylhomocysteine nucleosidase [Gemella sp. WT2a]